ncbi:hypothetical protein ISF_05145 [Cordyceps fumosorosea ARSEF 2679]|uniref:Uncharacterized protein n=1 Tax=Cordyceps fumosorosea (strain ARSEF 2679) TaxID=1081104 RepID=A0A167V1V6_CORFA|nr:hypothetical protein ISF_05145 [Cordyceps fumosorosea ARSEF 2679]OAA62136.1 hypothetical protein ISF_05145 [Cordyceps fumosorosea ARSEF 2679]
MARAGKLDEGGSARGLGIVNVPLPHHLSSSDHRGRYPTPPPPAAIAGIESKRAVRPSPESPPPPMLPVPARVSHAIPDTPSLEAAAAAPARTRSRRKTLLQRIEGWWDLGLLERRQTLLRSRSKTMAEQKL